jgi:hypothetical protein
MEKICFASADIQIKNCSETIELAWNISQEKSSLLKIFNQ